MKPSIIVEESAERIVEVVGLRITTKEQESTEKKLKVSEKRCKQEKNCTSDRIGGPT
jgi:hypothetical protein